jgi:hypothetical protein
MMQEQVYSSKWQIQILISVVDCLKYEATVTSLWISLKKVIHNPANKTIKFEFSFLISRKGYINNSSHNKKILKMPSTHYTATHD